MAPFFLNPVRTELAKPVLRLCRCEASWRGADGIDSIFVHFTGMIVRHQQRKIFQLFDIWDKKLLPCGIVPPKFSAIV